MNKTAQFLLDRLKKFGRADLINTSGLGCSINTNMLMAAFFLCVYLSANLIWAVMAARYNADAANPMYYIMILFWLGVTVTGIILYFVLNLQFDFIRRTRKWMPELEKWKDHLDACFSLPNGTLHFLAIIGIVAIFIGYKNSDWSLIQLGNMIWWPSITAYLVSWSLRITFSDEVSS